MQRRAGWVVVVTLAVVLSGFTLPAGASPGPVIESSTANEAEHALETAELCEGGPPDPETDVIGWEAGCWHNQSLAVDQTDGLNESERNATVARAMARVELIRELEFQQPVPVEIRSREEFQAARANDTVTAPLRTFDNAKFKALFLIGEDEDSIAVQNENAGTSILGFYSSQQKAIVVVSENASNLELDELTLGHELAHALQDQHFNLSRYDARTRDGANAQSGLIEGDASLVEYRYQQQCDEGAWAETCLTQTQGDGTSGELANIGTYLMKFQPYSDGPAFITSLYTHGGWETVNAAYEDPPRSSEQVIHPEKYPSDTPSEVKLEDRQSDDWERVRPADRPDHGTVGEAALTAMLVYPLYDSDGRTQIIRANQWLNVTASGQLSSFNPLNYDNRYSAGWDGDRLHVYVNDANETAYVWRLVWDSSGDAQEFVDGYEQVLEYWGGESVEPNVWVIGDGPFADAFYVRVQGTTVTIVNAPTVAELNDVRAGIRVTPTPELSPDGPSTATVTTTRIPDNRNPTISSPSQPGFGVLAALAALVAALLGRRRLG